MIIELTLLAIFMSLFSSTVQYFMVDKEELDATKKRLDKINKEYMKLLEEGDEKKIEKKKKELDELAQKLLSAPMRPLLVTLPVTLGLFYLMGVWFKDVMFEMPIIGKTGWVSYFIVIAIISNITFDKMLKRMRGKK